MGDQTPARATPPGQAQATAWAKAKAEAAEQAAKRAEEVLAFGRTELGAFAGRYQLGDNWADQVVSLDASGGLRAVLEQVSKLHDAALARPEIVRSDDGANFRVLSDTRTALECVRFAAHLLGYGRTLTDPTREEAKLTPEQKATRLLADPAIGAALRELIRKEGGK